MELNQREIRTLFLSDLHLGCQYSRADLILNFLESCQPDYLYLVGDIIDGWRLSRKHYWEEKYSDIIRRIIEMMQEGTQVFYIAGNHDEFMRHFMTFELQPLVLTNQAVHETIDGRRLLVVHGDMFDHITKHLTWLYHVGDKGYDLALLINSYINSIRRKLGWPYWSFSSMVKSTVKDAVNYINDFEHFAVKYTKKVGCDGVVCGHIHVPIIKMIDNIWYYNCGDWVENCTALVEYSNGEIELVWHPNVD